MHTAHVGYSRHLLAELKYSSAPYSMSLAFFALSSLDLLGALASITPAEKAGYVEWIYAQQHPQGGFRGSPFIGLAVSLLPEAVTARAPLTCFYPA